MSQKPLGEGLSHAKISENTKFQKKKKVLVCFKIEIRSPWLVARAEKENP